MIDFNEIKTLILAWIAKVIRSPFSNYATRFVLMLGGVVISTPLIEHLLLNIILKKAFGIDLGIEVPDANAYITGSILIALSLAHNLIFIKLNQDHYVKIKNTETSVYQAAWDKLDAVIDDCARLVHLYSTHYSPQDDALALKAEQSVIDCAELLRRNRPFYFSDDFYRQCIDITNVAYREAKAFRACIKMKIEEEETLGRNASPEDLSNFYQKKYDYELAQRQANSIIIEIMSKRDIVCQKIRSHISTI